MRVYRSYFFSTLYLIGFLTLILGCKPLYTATSHTNQIYKINASGSDTATMYLEQYLKPLRDSMDKSLNEVIAKAEGEFVKERPGGTLGFLVLEALMADASATNYVVDAVIYNYGGIRIPSIAKGPITLGKLYELLPFDNEMVILEISKEDWDTWMQLIQKSGGWPMYINKEHYSETAAIYRVVTNDYVANGGDQCDFLKKYKPKQSGKLVREVVINYLKSKGNIAPNVNYQKYSK